MSLEPAILNDTLWERIVELTNGAVNLCYQCGTCTATCPLGWSRRDPLTVRKLLRSAQLGLDSGDNGLWYCTTCKLCETRCPRDVEIVEAILGLRSVAFQERKAPPRLETALWGVYEDGNPWGGRSNKRAEWAEGLGIKDAMSGVKVLLYVGCASSFDPRLQKVAQAFSQILKATGVDFGILGQAEKCCGDMVNNVGERGFLEELVTANIAAFQKTGAEMIVALSPHCSNMFANVYPRYGAMIEALHYTQLLERLLDQGKLTFNNKKNVEVTYHDPCYLGRYNDVYEPPRRLLEAIPGLKLREMKDNRVNALCCGGGGGQMWLEPGEGERLSDIRIMQAVDTGAQSLITSCPYCIQNFEDSAKTKASGKVYVGDLLELVAQAMMPR